MLPYTLPPTPPAYVQFAQVYSCDTYGTDEYNECPTSSTSTPAQSDSSTTRDTPTTSTEPSTPAEPTGTSPSGGEIPSEQNPNQTNNPIVDAVVATSWWVIFGIALLVA